MGFRWFVRWLHGGSMRHEGHGHPRQKDHRQWQKDQPFDIDNVNHIGKFNDQITTYSNITMLLGSPTGSALLDTHEYNLYPAEKGYPLLKGNR